MSENPRDPILRIINNEFLSTDAVSPNLLAQRNINFSRHEQANPNSPSSESKMIEPENINETGTRADFFEPNPQTSPNNGSRVSAVRSNQRTPN